MDEAPLTHAVAGLDGAVLIVQANFFYYKFATVLCLSSRTSDCTLNNIACFKWERFDLNSPEREWRKLESNYSINRGRPDKYFTACESSLKQYLLVDLSLLSVA